MRISDWSSDVVLFRSPCTVRQPWRGPCGLMRVQDSHRFNPISQGDPKRCGNSQALLQLSLSAWPPSWPPPQWRRTPPRRPSTRSEEHTSELQSLMRNSYAVFCLKTKKHKHKHTHSTNSTVTPNQH